MKKLVLAATLGFFSLYAAAQDLLVGNQTTDNWYIGMNAGAVTPLKHHAFFPNMRPAFGLEFGKQLTPILGIGLEGMWSVNTSNSHTVFDHSNISLLGKINLNNLFGKYPGAPRAFEVEAVAGLGWLHAYQSGEEDTNALTSKIGLNFNYNLGERKAWTLAFKPALVYNLQGDNPAHTLRFNANNATVELTAGLIYHFGGSNGEHYRTFAKAYDLTEVKDLNTQINDLRAEMQNKEHQAQAAQDAANRQINDLQKALEECRSKEPEVVTNTNATLESYVTFRQGRTSIDASQLPNVERIATYMKNHPSSKVVIKGYASPEGSAEVNTRIANQRAEAVKSTLIKRYKVDAERITAEGQGVGDMFSEPDWNRVSICTLEEGK